MRDGVIYTPPKTAILEGITRDSLIKLAEYEGYRVEQETLSRDQLYIADEIFVTGTAAEVTPISSVDYRPVGEGRRGPVTHVLQKRFFELVRGEGPFAEQWLDWRWSASVQPEPAAVSTS